MANKSFNAKHGVSVGSIATDIISSTGNINTPGTITSSIATGTAPLAVSSTTRVANLNVATAGNADTVTDGVYTLRRINTTEPVSGGGDLSANRTISLASAYGDTQNPYGSKTANWILAAPNGGAGAPVFRAMVAADVPTLNQNTTGNATTATSLQVARSINGTSFNGSANITTASWGTGRTITIGSTGKTVDGSGNVSWSWAELGVPSTTGSGASGNWGINITGNAATATTASSCSGNSATATTASAVSGSTVSCSGRISTTEYVHAAYLNMSHASSNVDYSSVIVDNGDGYMRKVGVPYFNIRRNRVVFARETQSGVCANGYTYSIYTGGAVTMYLPYASGTAQGDTVRFVNLHRSWGNPHNFTLARPDGNTRIHQLNEDLLCDMTVGGFDMVCVYHDGVAYWNIV
jgi:hypothetical protein